MGSSGWTVNVLALGYLPVSQLLHFGPPLVCSRPLPGSQSNMKLKRSTWCPHVIKSRKNKTEWQDSHVIVGLVLPLVD